MKVRDLIDMIKDYEDYDVAFALGNFADNTHYGLSVLFARDLEIADIGWSEKDLLLGYTDDFGGQFKIEY